MRAAIVQILFAMSHLHPHYQLPALQLDALQQMPRVKFGVQPIHLGWLGRVCSKSRSVRM